MSGEGLGLLFVAPLIVGAVMVAGGAMLVGGAVYGVVRLGIAAANFAMEQHDRRVVRSNSAPYQRVAMPTTTANRTTANRTTANRTTAPAATVRSSNMASVNVEKKYNFNSNVDLDKLSKELENKVNSNQRAFEEMLKNEAKSMQEEMNAMDHESLAEYIENLSSVREDSFREIKNFFEKTKRDTADVANNLLQDYRTRTSEANSEAQKAIEDFINNREDKEQAQREICRDYISDIKQLISDVRELFSKTSENERFNALVDNYNAAVDQYNNGNYEACIAVMVTLRGLIGEQVYELERKEHEKEALYQMALTLTEQTKNFLESQNGFNAETIQLLADQGIEVSLPKELMGIEYVLYADRDPSGKNRLLKIKSEVDDIYNKLTASNPNEITEEELQIIIDKMAKEKYPQAYKEVNACMENIANTYYRVGQAGDFMDFLEEKGLVIEYVENQTEDADGIVDATSPIIIAVYDDVLKESVTYTLRKSGSSGFIYENDGIEYENDYKAVEIKYDCVSGKNITEARNQYYQGLANEFMGIEMGCRSNTVGRTSENVSEVAKQVLESIEQEYNQ